MQKSVGLDIPTDLYRCVLKGESFVYDWLPTKKRDEVAVLICRQRGRVDSMSMMLNDDNLSWQAKGLLAYLLAKPDDWKVIISDLEKRSANGRDSVQNILKELQKKGYVERIQHKEASTGRFTHVETVVYELPQERLLVAGDNAKQDHFAEEASGNG